MEKLTQQQLETVKKMSSDRLRLKLLAFGYAEEEVVELDRGALINMYVELLAAGKVPVGATASPGLTYDVELEKQKFQFEQERWRAEMSMKEEQMTEMRLEREMKERQMQLDAEQLEIRKRELEQSEARKDSAAAKGKLFGDAMRASAIRMGPDILDIIPFFKNVENLFQVYQVPKELESVLIRPFLNDKAKVLLTQLDPTVAADYGRMKDAMLREFQLSPSKYLEKFNTYKKPESETYVMFASKLCALLDYYLQSRNVDTFELLRELLICDRIKLSLPEACLRHVVAIESVDKNTPWLPIDQLTRTVDTFLANHKPGNIPVAMSVNQSMPRFGGYAGPTVRPVMHPPVRSFLQRAAGTGNAVRQGNVGSGGAVNFSRRCYLCNSPGHLRSQCPKAAAQTSQAGVRRVAVQGDHTSAINSTDHATSRRGPDRQQESASVSPVACMGSDAAFSNRPTDTLTSDCVQPTSVPLTCPDVCSTQNSVETSSVSHSNDVTNDKVDISDSRELVVDRQAVIAETVPMVMTDVNGKIPTSSVDIAISSLKYIDVSVAVDDVNVVENISGVCDSGAECCVIRADLVAKYFPTVLGRVVLRPFFGEPIAADVIRVYVSLTDNPDRGIYIYAASVENANDPLLLTDEAVNRLTSCQYDISRVVTRSEAKLESDNVVNTDLTNVSDVPDTQTINLNTANADINDVENLVGSDDACDEVMGDDVLSADDVCTGDVTTATRAELISEQKNDPSLNGCWKLAEKLRGGFITKDGILYKRERWYGQEYLQLVAPSTRRKHILTMGHDTVGGHMSAKRTKQRISLSFWWPGLNKECKEYVKTCSVCQKKARVTYRDRVPIKAIPLADRVLNHWWLDCLGPIFSGEGPKPLYNYALIAVDSASRFPAAYALKSLTAKSVCDAILKLWQFTGASSYISTDLGQNFVSELTREFERRLGCSPRFNSPYHPPLPVSQNVGLGM